MSTHFLHLPRKAYYYRSVVPKNLRSLLNGREQIWRSLKTADKDEAQARSAAWESRVQQLFLALRKHGGRMNNEEREALVAHWLQVELNEAEDARTLAGPISDEYREGVWHVLSDQFDEANEALLTNNWRKIEKEADELLKSAGVPALDHDGADFGRLCRRLLLAKQEYLRIEADRWEGKYTINHVQQRPATAPATVGNKAQAPACPLFSVVAEKFIAETMQPKSRSIKPLRAEILKFLDAIKGDRPINTITKEDTRGYKDHLLTVRKLSFMTVGKHVMSLQAIFKFALSQGYLPEGKSNPFGGLAPSKKIIRKTKLYIREFSESEMLTIFGSKDFFSQRTENPSRYWVCLMALFMGLRREEAAQAAVANIHKSDDGIYYLQTAVDETLHQNLKNEGSKRRVPIHSSLIDIGFLDYVKRIKQAGDSRLFPDLKKGGNGYGDAVGKWFGRHVTSVGLLDPALVFHSTRHTGSASLLRTPSSGS